MTSRITLSDSERAWQCSVTAGYEISILADKFQAAYASAPYNLYGDGGTIDCSAAPVRLTGTLNWNLSHLSFINASGHAAILLG